MLSVVELDSYVASMSNILSRSNKLGYKEFQGIQTILRAHLKMYHTSIRKNHFIIYEKKKLNQKERVSSRNNKKIYACIWIDTEMSEWARNLC